MGLVQIGGEIRAKPLNDNFAYLDGKLLFGPESNRPNPGVTNRLYVTTDTGIVYADTGTDWIQVGGISEIDWSNIIGKPSTFPPSPHANQHRSGGSDPITPADIGAASQVDFDAHLAEDVTQGASPHGIIYERGIWTPRMAYSSPGSVPPVVNSSGVYVRQGSQITLYGDIEVIDLGDTGVTVQIKDMPFPLEVGRIQTNVFLEKVDFEGAGGIPAIHSSAVNNFNLIVSRNNNTLVGINRGHLSVGSKIKFIFSYTLS